MANMQAKFILEQTHQVISYLICTFDLQNNYQDEDDPWAGILSADAFMVKNVYYVMLQATPIQRVFRCDMILNTHFISEWEASSRFKQ